MGRPYLKPKTGLSGRLGPVPVEGWDRSQWKAGDYLPQRWIVSKTLSLLLVPPLQLGQHLTVLDQTPGICYSQVVEEVGGGSRTVWRFVTPLQAAVDRGQWTPPSSLHKWLITTRLWWVVSTSWEGAWRLTPPSDSPLWGDILLQRGVVVAADCQQQLSLWQLSMLKVNMKSLGDYLFYI